MGIGSSHNESKTKNIRVLILGIQSSGKTTFSKQMKILHCDGFRKEELINYRVLLMQNLFLGMKEILETADEKLLKTNKKYSKIIQKFNPYENQVNERIFTYVQRLWEDDSVQEVVKNSYCSGLILEYVEIVKYLMKSGIMRLKNRDFIPTNKDILHIRQRTAGISETKFKRDKFNWNFIDVGGQRVERRKWIDINRNLTAIIFLASLIDYDIGSEYDATRTRMEESLEVWDEVLQGRCINNMPLILFFNKIDLFKKKLKRCGLTKTFKNYKGGEDLEKALKFIMKLYLRKLRDNSNIRPQNVKCHFICALDTENIRIVYSDIKNHIIKQRLALSGI